MKIITIARTLNEEASIDMFCQRYGFSDRIIISDGGSTDRTVELARKYPNVEVFEDFPHKVPMHPEFPNMYYTNEPLQINFLIDTAMQHRPDWIIYDDADCWPCEILSRDARSMFESTNEGIIEIFRYYIYGHDRYFPQLNVPGQSLWAWNPNKVAIRCDEKGDPREQNMRVLTKDGVYRSKLNPPYVLLHYYARSEEEVLKSLYWYAMKDQPKRHPLFGGGPLEPLPEYAK